MKSKNRFFTVFLAVILVVGIIPFLPVAQAQNPYLPMWEHLPDGEPRVFEYPVGSGQYRIFIYGSHDLRNTEYCGPDVRAWSAPVEDLSNWRDEGPVFTYQDPNNGVYDLIYAPDIVEVTEKDGKKVYYLFPHSIGSGRTPMVCKSDSPVGPFEPLNLNADGSVYSGSIMGFDPGVYVEQITDPADPDYDIGYRMYGYWGAAFQSDRSKAAELNPEKVWEARYGASGIISNFMPCSTSYGILSSGEPNPNANILPGEDITKFNFFEASSIRKVGNKYIMIFSGYSGPDYGLSSTNSAMRWCYADHPLGPWKLGGVLVDSRAPVVNESGNALMTSNSGHNTHGSIEEINGQWYAFYHRPPRGFGYARQSMVAPIQITWDEASVADGGKVTIRAYDPYSADQLWTAKASNGDEYTGAEVTSEGFQIFGLDPYEYYSAGIACYLSNPGLMKDSFDIWDNHMPIEDVKNRIVIGYKYFGFGGLDSAEKGIKPFEGTKPGNNTVFNLFLTPKSANEIKINVWMDSPWNNAAWNGTKIGEIIVPANSAQTPTQYSVNVSEFVDKLDGKHAIYLVGEGTGAVDLIGLGFSSDTKPIKAPVVPSVSISVDGQEIELPKNPVRSTGKNGITGYDLYECAPYKVAEDHTAVPVVTASSDVSNVGITITQADSVNGTAVVKFDFNGVVKTFNVGFTNVGPPPVSAADDILIDFEKNSGASRSGVGWDPPKDGGTITDGVLHASSTNWNSGIALTIDLGKNYLGDFKKILFDYQATGGADGGAGNPISVYLFPQGATIPSGGWLGDRGDDRIATIEYSNSDARKTYEVDLSSLSTTLKYYTGKIVLVIGKNQNPSTFTLDNIKLIALASDDNSSGSSGDNSGDNGGDNSGDNSGDTGNVNPTNPKTGVNTHTALWGVLGLFGLLAAVILFRKRKNVA